MIARAALLADTGSRSHPVDVLNLQEKRFMLNVSRFVPDFIVVAFDFHSQAFYPTLFYLWDAENTRTVISKALQSLSPDLFCCWPFLLVPCSNLLNETPELIFMLISFNIRKAWSLRGFLWFSPHVENRPYLQLRPSRRLISSALVVLAEIPFVTKTCWLRLTFFFFSQFFGGFTCFLLTFWLQMH